MMEFLFGMYKSSINFPFTTLWYHKLIMCMKGMFLNVYKWMDDESSNDKGLYRK